MTKSAALTQAERQKRTNLKAAVKAGAMLLGGEVLDVAGVIFADGEYRIYLHDGTRIVAEEVKQNGLDI